MGPSYSPLLPDEADVELAALQVFAGVAHDLVEGILEQMITADDQPETQTRVSEQRVEQTHAEKTRGRKVSPHKRERSTYFSFPGPWP